MSSDALPSLGRMVPTLELFMRGWEQLAKQEPRLAPWIDNGLHWAYRYYKRTEETDAYLLAMCKLPIKLYCVAY
jgi:hypothetical protein